jgi:hypothetical protein
MRSNARSVRAVRKIVSGAMNGLVDSVGVGGQGRVGRGWEEWVGVKCSGYDYDDRGWEIGRLWFKVLLLICWKVVGKMCYFPKTSRDDL